jgi:hypothetical protein
VPVEGHLGASLYEFVPNIASPPHPVKKRFTAELAEKFRRAREEKPAYYKGTYRVFVFSLMAE